MRIESIEYFGNPLIGLFITTNEDITFVPRNIPDETIEKIESTLKTDVVRISLYNSSLIGLFMCLNSQGAIVPEIAYSNEVNQIKKYLDNLVVIKNFTAVGNLISLNDSHALASPVLKGSDVKKIEKNLDVQVSQRRIAEMDVTGSLVYITNQGFLLTPLATRQEFDEIKEELGVPGAQTTLNYGNPMIKSGIVANSKGALVGSMSTPYEMGKVDEAFFVR